MYAQQTIVQCLFCHSLRNIVIMTKSLMTFIVLLTLVFTSSLAVAASLTYEQEGVLASDLEKQMPTIAEHCLQSSQDKNEYDMCVLSNLRDLVVNGNALASISIIAYLMEFKREDEAYKWYVYAMESNLSHTTKEELKSTFATLVSKFNHRP